MSPDSIPPLSLGTVALAIFAICAGFVILRGLTRLVVGTAILGVSAWAGFLLWQNAPAWSLAWTGKSADWITTGLPVAGFLVTFLLLRKLAKMVTRPFGNTAGENRPRSAVSMVFRLIFALVPTSLLWLVGATFVHHTGSVADLRAYSEKSRGAEVASSDGFAKRLKSSVESMLPKSWILFLDPMADPSRVTLAKLVTRQASPDLPPVIDPSTGKPFPRAIIVDPDLQNLARDGKFGTLLRHPLLTKALADPKTRQMVSDLHL